MTSKADWPVAGAPVDQESQERLFFDEHQWVTVEAATARIMPTDHDPGAKEAGVVVFIDRYLSGIGYIYAAADGRGFLQMSGKEADAWRERILEMQKNYREGVQKLDDLSHEKLGADFKDLGEDGQDEVLEALSGFAKPEPMALAGEGGYGSFLQGVSDEGMDFFNALVTHTRQGFYGDPVYGGNKDHVGWKVVGYPGPESLADTNTCRFSLRDYFVQEYEWTELVPYLKEQRERTGSKGNGSTP